MAFRVSIVLSFSYILIGILLTSGDMTTPATHHSDYIIRVYNLLSQSSTIRDRVGGKAVELGLEQKRKGREPGEAVVEGYAWANLMAEVVKATKGDLSKAPIWMNKAMKAERRRDYDVQGSR